MEEQVAISVILTSYNKGNFIGKAIESVLNQSYKNLELIIVDDGSTDNSKEVITDYTEKDTRVKAFFFEENKGIPSAHNLGLEKAQGKYCAMIDCDDFWEKDKLKKQIEFLEEHEEYGACFTWIRVVDENETPVSSEECENRDIMWNSNNHTQGEWLRIFFFEGCKLGNPSMMIRREVLEQVGYYSYGLKQLQDYELFIRILKKCNVYIIQEKLVNYRWFQGEIKNTSFENVESASRSNFEYYLICKNFFKDMNYDIFKDGFSQCVKGKCETVEEMVCEQVFITRDKYLVPVVGRAVALENLYLLLNHEHFRRLMELKYNLNSTSFAEQIKEAIFYDEKYYIPKDQERYGKILEDKIEKLTKEWYKTAEYNKELIATTKESEEYAMKTKAYLEELENASKNQSEIVDNQNKAIQEQENRAKEQNEQMDKQRSYIKELEKKVHEMSNLYLKCNEYAVSLEEKVQEMSDLYLRCNEYAMSLEERIRALEN